MAMLYGGSIFGGDKGIVSGNIQRLQYFFGRKSLWKYIISQD
jgi:hypothetical protein